MARVRSSVDMHGVPFSRRHQFEDSSSLECRFACGERAQDLPVVAAMHVAKPVKKPLSLRARRRAMLVKGFILDGFIFKLPCSL